MSPAYSPLPLASPPLPFLRLPLAVPEAPSYVKLVLVLGSLTLILGKGRMETTVDNLSMAYGDFMAPSHDHSLSWAPTHVQLVWSWPPTVLGRRSDEELPAPSPRPSLPSRQSGKEERENDEWVSFVIVYMNEFEGSNLGGVVVEAKN
jgi:hypothetical protein